MRSVILVLVGGALGVASALGALTGCSDQPYDPEAPAIDPTAPRVHITTPARGTFAGDVQTLAVRGTATDDAGVTSVIVNGVDAVVAADGTWQATVPVTTGTQLIHAVARDAQGNLGKESRAVVIGRLQPIASAVPEAITAAMSAQTFDAIGRGIAGYLATGNPAALVASLNPVVDIGGGPGNNYYVQGSITSITAGPATAVSLVPQHGGLALALELDRVAVRVHLAYALFGVPGSRDITIAASHIKVTGNLDVGLAGGGFDVKLADQRVAITGLDVDLGGLPGGIADLVHLDGVLGPVIELLTEKLVVPMLNTALGGLDHTQTLDVLGTPVDIQVTPARILFDDTGAVIELDTALRAHGDAASPGYVYVANETPVMSTDRGFQLAIADDAANQLLGSFWAAKGLDVGFDLTTGNYGQIGKLYDRVELSAAVPPFVDARGGALKLTIGDLVATFKHGASIATQVAVSAEVAIQVVTASDGTPRLDVGNPTTYVDVLDEHVDGANALSNAQFEAITSFALARVIAVGSGAVGAIPLPSFGGVALHDVAIAEQAGYLVVAGQVR